MEEEQTKRQKEDILNAGLAGSSYEIIQKYGSANKEHYVAYSGKDNELGRTLSKGLKQIHDEKINPEYKFQNIHQQAGFSAEVKDVARTNAENTIQGKAVRKIRTDDLGRVNDPLYDTVSIDKNGNIIEGSGAQMKFLGASENDPKGEGNVARALEKLQSKKFQKYLDADTKIDVPSNQYDNLISEADSKIQSLTEQLDNQKKVGNEEQVQKLQEKIDKLEKIKRNLRRSSVSSDEAVLARLHPKLSTAIDVAKVSHRAGIQTAQSSAAIGGTVSIVKNIVAVIKEEEDPLQAMKNVAKDTSITAGFGYATGFTGAALKGAMQNSQSGYIRALAKTNVAGTIVAVSVSATKTLSRYIRGEIDGLECLETLGEQGSGMIASSMFSVVGQVAIPIPVVGGLIGGMVGYALSSASYGVLTESLKNAKLAKEEREKIEKICEEHIVLIRQYRTEMESIINEYLADSMEVFRESFLGIKNALAIGDVDWFIDSTNEITKRFGGQIAFSNMEEFNQQMLGDETFYL